MYDEGDAFLGDVNYSVHTMMCGYYKTTKDYIHECLSAMKVLLFYLMLVLMYILCFASIVKQ
jgi:hypothetical protein